ncbi:MAG: PTS sugar transporter subunit IIB [Gemmatimonadetes bacterium]|nr:PTS sugar transporter subunit IIB [Gemmatimonadota bacterium]
MTLSLVRVDDRLIHGQVVVGWGQALGARQLVLVDDEVSANQWERDIYRVGVPLDMTIEFASVEQAARRVPDWDASSRRTIVVLGDVAAAVRLCELAPEVKRVNLGGIHPAPGRRQRLPYVFMTDSEAGALAALAARGVEITAQDVPTARPVPLQELT